LATRVGPKVQSVLGLSMTSTSVGWVLLDGQGPDAATLDHDAFDVQSGGDAASCDTSVHAAAARGAQAIATASGHKVGAVQVTWTPEVEAAGTTLLKSLSELGFDNVVAVPLNQATRAWGIESGRENEQHKTALCVLEPGAATVMVVATGAGTVRTAVIDNRGTTADLIERIRTVFRKDGWLPECVHLVGSRVDLDEVCEPITAALPLPVIDTVDTQLALARGAALATVEQADTGPSEPAETKLDQPWRVEVAKPAAVPAATEALAAAPVSTVSTSSSPIAETPRKDPPPRRERPWVATHAKKLAISAAAVATFGAALSLAAGSALNVENMSAQATNPAAGSGSVTSASVHPVPAPVSAPTPSPVQPLAAEPPPPAPPEPIAPPVEPVVTMAPEPVSVPVPQQTISAPPAAAPLAAPAPAPTPIAPPPVAALAAPLPAEGPAPAAAPMPAAVQAPVAPPPAAPAPIAPPPPGPAPAEPPPPPDPVQAALSPLFSGLP
jgi:hypothetical protein